MICVNLIINQLTGAQNIRASCILVKNRLGNISGTYNASESLIIDTVRGYMVLRILRKSTHHISIVLSTLQSRFLNQRVVCLRPTSRWILVIGVLVVSPP